MEQSDYRWIESPVKGATLKFMGASNDSQNNPIEAEALYKIGKHTVTGEIIIQKVTSD